jgi:ADP-ribosylglycohydrolase
MRSALAAILGSFRGIATGDAIGKQTETLSRDDVSRWYPDGVRGFEGEPGAVIPRYAGNRKHEWRIGETTDDTERTIAVARAILDDRAVRHTTVGRELLACRKSVHAGVASLWEFHQAADPARVTDRHDGCGAAVRVAPVGMLFGSDRLADLVAGAREASISTHGGAHAIAAAAATAAAVSAALDGRTSDEVIGIAQRAAAEAEQARSGSCDHAFAEAIGRVHAEVRERPVLCPDDIAARHFPDRTLTIVPLALALGTLMRSAEAAILLAANVGGDADSVASIAGAILGARYPDTVNHAWCAVVETINRHDVVSLARRINALRR